MQIIQSPLLNKFSNLKHCFTTTKVGNIAFHVNDDIKNVEANHDKLALLMGYEKNSLVHMKQIHSNDVHLVTENDNYTNPKKCDALVTNKLHTPLMVMVADCSPILLYDHTNRVIAVVHAGRQGAFKNIIYHTIKAMKNRFESDPKNIYVSIGASIGECCYEVGNEIYEEAIQKDLLYAMSKKGVKHHLNISKILHTQLLDSGIKEEHIEISNECTACNTQIYYSYRGDPKTGRFAGLIYLC